jgi:hypothetical protein
MKLSVYWFLSQNDSYLLQDVSVLSKHSFQLNKSISNSTYLENITTVMWNKKDGEVAQNVPLIWFQILF